MTTKTRTKANLFQMKFGQFYVINGQVLRYSSKDFMNRLHFTYIVDGDMVVVKFEKKSLPEIFNF